MKRLVPMLTAAALLAPGPALAAWRLLPFPREDATLRAVAVEGPGRFHVSGSKGTYAATRDGGRSWRLSAPAGGKDLDYRGLAVVGPGQVVLMSAGDGPAGQARLYRTDDGGADWRLVYETRLEGAFLDGVAFWSGQRGLVMGDPINGRWFLLATRDAGRSWTRIIPHMAPLEPGEAAFAASNSALFLGPGREAWIVSGGRPRARAFHSADGGRTWAARETPIAGGATAGVFGGMTLGRGRAVAVGGDHKDETRASRNVALASGAAWSPAAADGSPGLLEGVGRLGPRHLLAVGPRGTWTSRDDGASWRKVDDEAFHAIACKAGTCVAAGSRGRVAVWTAEP